MYHRSADRHTRKRYFWSLMVTCGLWAWVGGVILFVSPEQSADFLITGSYLSLIVPVFLAVWFSGSLVFGNTKAGGVLALGLIVTMYLRIMRLGAWWVLVPWWGLILTIIVAIMMQKKIDKIEAG